MLLWYVCTHGVVSVHVQRESAVKRDGRSTAMYCFNVIIPFLCDGTRVFCFCFAHSVVFRISQNHDSPPRVANQIVCE